MRLIGCLLLGVAACAPSSTGSQCHIDSHCSGDEVCARDDTCWPASSVRTVEITWTVHGMPANTMSCGSIQDLFLEFTSATEDIGYAPVPCRTGLFTIVNLPKPYDTAEIGIEGGWATMAAISAQDTVAFDLLF